MFGSTILEMAIGLALIYLLLSLICSVINELFAGIFDRRALHLEQGIAALLQDLRMGGEYGLPDRSVIVLDEASMAGTRQLAELLDHADAAKAKVVLVGDPHQLPEIDAGGAFRALVLRTDPIELTNNRRQRNEWERESLDHLREGRTAEAIERYRRHGRIVLGEGAEDVRQRLVADWWQAAGDAAMIALRRADVADLNARARALMQSHGRLGTDERRRIRRNTARTGRNRKSSTRPARDNRAAESSRRISRIHHSAGRHRNKVLGSLRPNRTRT